MADSKLQAITGKRLPPNAGKGRPAGAVNKTTATLKAALEQSFSELGGVRWLVQLAEREPRAYAALLAKLLPTQIDADVTAHPPITKITRVVVDPQHGTETEIPPATPDKEMNS
ncbi:hypothetical protein [Acidithiobacillus sp.]|uniref:hypothetical protein n=1 Tax=Acidithiobacillus sp. TaxID=1872118 RepID=UPI0025C2D37F|nr:hypothetical protein [Acidithiobacillus sp.]